VLQQHDTGQNYDVIYVLCIMYILQTNYYDIIIIIHTTIHSYNCF
jgi:hypothetical protein